MPLEADITVDRRRLKRHLSLWRVLAIAFGVALVVAAFGRFDGILLPGQRYVALLPVEGLIVADTEREQALDLLIEDDRAAAVMVWINSPGGTTYGSEALYRALRRVAESKPVVAVMGTVAASGGYMAAIAADYIVARESTLTGSIGVLWEATNIIGLLDMLGIESESIKSAPLKAQPSLIEPLNDEGRAVTQAVVDESHRMFVDMVAARRPLDPARLAEVTDGRVFTGTMAREQGLIDAIGGEREARRWLEEVHGVDADLPLRPVEIEREDESTLGLFTALIGKSFLPEQLKLDGLISLWQPADGR